MKKTVRHAFTIVELVIVIAVIAVLASVLMPTISGMIKSANKVADEHDLTSLNRQLAISGTVTSDEELAKVIETVFGDRDLAPRSADAGYHYWYDVKNNTVLLKSYEEIEALNSGAVMTHEGAGLVASTVSLDTTFVLDAEHTAEAYAEASSKKNGNFADDEKDSFRMFGNYYILDNGGSVIGEALGALRSGVEVADKVSKLVGERSYSNNKAMAEALIEKISATAIVGNDKTFVFNAEKVEKFYFAPGIETISSTIIDANNNSIEYIAKLEGNVTITIPSTVKTVEENALIIAGGADVTLKTSFRDIDEIAEAFKANSANGTIICANDNEYIIDGNKLTDSEGNATSLAYGNPVIDFEIVTPEDTESYMSIVNTVYIAYNYTGEIQLVAGNFVGKNDVVSSEEVVWESDSEHVIVDGGKIRYDGNPELVSATITASAVASEKDAEVKKSVDVHIVRPVDAEFILGSKTLSMIDDEDPKIIEYTYNGENAVIGFEAFSIDFGALEVIASELTDLDKDVSITTAGTLFSITDNVLTLNESLAEVAGEQEFTVSIGSSLTKTFKLVVEDKSADPFKVKEPFAHPKFLYRIGNGNEVLLSTFFANDKPAAATELIIKDYTKNGYIGCDKNFTATVNGNSSGNGVWSVDADGWATASVKFMGTGVTTIKLGEASVTVEVVDGINATSYSDFKSGSNIVMLGDITIADGARVYFIGTTLYGNDFVFDVRIGNYDATPYADGSSSLSDNCVVYLSNGTLDNVRIIGKAFTGFSAVTKGNDNICNVLSVGNDRIINCLITNCAAPVRVKGNTLEIANTTLVGGSIANLDIREGDVTLDNVTTVNQKNANSIYVGDEAVGSIGFGIMVWYEGVTKANITVKNTLTQYNWLSESDFESIPLDFNGVNMSSTVTNLIFNSSESGTDKFIYVDGNGEKWVNTGIFSMTSAVGSDNIKISEFESKTLYSGASVSATYLTQKFSGYLYSINKENAYITYPEHDYASAGQGTVRPSFTVDNGKNQENKVEGSNVYCYYDGTTIYISFDYKGSKQFDISGLCKAIKGLSELAITNVYLDGKLIDTDSVITFDSTGDHVLTFEFADKYNYDKNGNEYVVEYSKIVNISVTEVEPDAKNAEFYFFGNTNYPAKPVLIGNTTYLTLEIDESTDVASMNGSHYMVLKDGNKVWKTTISGTNIYYPVVDIVMSDGKTSHTSGWYAYFNVFSGVITIVDYDASGNQITYNAATTNMPSSLAPNDPANAFKYASASSANPTPQVKNGVLLYSSAKIEAKRAEQTFAVTYTYKDNTGKVFTYYISYYTPAQTYTNTCVTPDTLVTLADGTQKEIQYVTYEDRLLVWDFYKGEYNVVGASIVMNHGYDDYNVLTLNFADGTAVNTINGHGFFDAAENKYVILDAKNVADYLGHDFVKVDGNGYSTTKLVDYSVSMEHTESWSILTAEYYNCILGGMWSLTPAEVEGSPDYLMPFEIKDMRYDEASMQADIEKYGLYTYDEFADLITLEQFDAFGLSIFKVGVGKGYITYEDIITLIGIHC